MWAFFDIKGIIDAILDERLGGFFATVAYYATFAWIQDPLLGWAAYLALLYLAVLVVCYFFGTFWPILRVIGGGLLAVATFGLYTYYRGRVETRAWDAKSGKKRR